VSAYLSEAWRSEVASLLSGLPVEPGAFSGVVRWTVGKAPGGDAAFTWVWRDGVVVDVRDGADPGAGEPDIELTMAYPDHRALTLGEVSPPVAYMRGKLKAAGHSGKVLALLQRTADPAFAAAWAEVGRRTDVDVAAG
jgi:hypothetical protein